MNRAILLLLLIVLLTKSSMAQIGKGKYFFAGAFGVSIDQTITNSSGTTTKSDPSFNIGFYPKAGYFVNSNVAIGAGLGYLSGSSNRGASASKLYGFSPFVRKYFSLGEQGNCFLFAQISIDYGFGKLSETVAPTTGQVIIASNKINTFGFGISPGFTLFPTKRIATEFTFGYIPLSIVDRQNYLLGFTSITTKPDPNPTDDSKKFRSFGLGFRSLISTSLAFKIYLGGNK